MVLKNLKIVLALFLIAFGVLFGVKELKQADQVGGGFGTTKIVADQVGGGFSATTPIYLADQVGGGFGTTTVTIPTTTV